jgi:hypothetical protein
MADDRPQRPELAVNRSFMSAFLDFAADADTVAFKLRWPDLWG